MIVGENMAETRPVGFGLINDCRLRNKARMVVADPRQTVTASKADLWLPIRPGTDMALALGMAHHLITHDLVNRGFITRWVEGYERVKDFILQKGYTPEWAASITDIQAARIRKVAEEIRPGRTGDDLCQPGTGPACQRRSDHPRLHDSGGHHGAVGRKGATVQMSSSGKMLGTSLSEADLGKGLKPGIAKSPLGWFDAVVTGKPYPIKALIWAGNPFGLWPGLSRFKEGLKNLEVIAHLEIWKNDTSFVSDYIFPSAHGVEYGEVNRSTEDRRALWIRKMIDPPGDARPDLYFWVELGKRFGMQDSLKEEFKESAFFFDSEMRASPLVKGITVKRMMESPKGFLRMPLPG